MIRIREVRLEGIFGHLDSKFELADTLTVVTGANGSGKSSFNFALYWVFVGEPEGEELIFQLVDEKTKAVVKETKAGKVIVSLDNGIIISKTRTRGGRTVYTHSDFKDPFTQSAVPQCVIDSLGIVETTFGDLDRYMNFYFQHDNHFMLSDPPTMGAKVLDRLAGVEIVSLALSEFKSDKHQAETDKNQAKKEIQRINADLFKYEQLDTYRLQIDTASDMLKKIDEKAGLIEKLKGLLEIKNRLNLTVQNINTVLKGIGDLTDLKQRLWSLEDTLNLRLKLADYQDRIKHNMTYLSEAVTRLNLIGSLQPLKQQAFDLSRNHALMDRLTGLQESIIFCNKSIKKSNDILVTLQSLSNIKTSLQKQVIDRCNLCLDLTQCHYMIISRSDILKRVTDTLLQYQGIDQLRRLSVTLKAANEKRMLLSGLMTRLKVLQDTKNRVNNDLSRYDNVKDLVTLTCNLKAVYHNFVTVTCAKGMYDRASLNMKSVTGFLQDQNTFVTQCQKELQDAWDLAGGMCPLCKNPVNGGYNHE